MLRLLLPLPLGKDFLQALSFKSHSSTSGLCHLLREFEPVSSHDYEDTLPAPVLKIFSCISHPFAKNAKGWGTRPRSASLDYFSVARCMYIDWIATRSGPVKRFQTICPALASKPVEIFWNWVSICTVRSL